VRFIRAKLFAIFILSCRLNMTIVIVILLYHCTVNGIILYQLTMSVLYLRGPGKKDFEAKNT
jgi:hypothetical protein